MSWPRPSHLQVQDGRATPQLSAEVYGEPQTSQAARAGQNGDRKKFSTGGNVEEPAILRPETAGQNGAEGKVERLGDGRKKSGRRKPKTAAGGGGASRAQ